MYLVHGHNNSCKQLAQMSFGASRGIGWTAFQKLVKRLTYVVIRGDKRYEVDLPLTFYNVPIFSIQVELPKD